MNTEVRPASTPAGSPSAQVLDGFTGGLVGALKRLVPPRDDRNSRRNSLDLQNLMIREAGTDDAPAIRCICLETGDAGRDGRPLPMFTATY